MNCEQVRDYLSGYLDNVLAADDRVSLALHLQTCMKCSTILIDFRRFDTLLAQLPRVSPTATLQKKIFFSAEFYELTGTGGIVQNRTQGIISLKHAGYYRPNRPHLVILPGGCNGAHASLPSHLPPRKKRLLSRSHLLLILLIVMLLLAISIAGLIGWLCYWQNSQPASQRLPAITLSAAPALHSHPCNLKQVPHSSIQTIL